MGGRLVVGGRLGVACRRKLLLPPEVYLLPLNLRLQSKLLLSGDWRLLDLYQRFVWLFVIGCPCEVPE